MKSSIVFKKISLITSIVIVGIIFFVPISLPIISKSSHALAKAIAIFQTPLIFLYFIKNHKKFSINFFLSGVFPLLFLFTTAVSSIFSLTPAETLKTIAYIGAACWVYYATIFAEPKHRDLKFINILLIVLAAISSIISLAAALLKLDFLIILEDFLPPVIHQSIKSAFFLDDRIFPVGYFFIFSPIYLIEILSNKSRNLKILYFFSFAILQVAILLTNWRTLVIGNLFSLIAFVVINKLYRYWGKKELAFIGLFTLVIGLITASLASINFQSNIFTRFILKDEKDVVTITNRLVILKDAAELFLSSPIVGTGLGSYIPLGEVHIKDLVIKTKTGFVTEKFPDFDGSAHNMFMTTLAETGVLGAVPLVITLLIFLYSDWRFIKENHLENSYRFKTATAFMVLSWTFLLDNLTENVLFYNGFVVFFFLRGILGSKNLSS